MNIKELLEQAFEAGIEYNKTSWESSCDDDFIEIPDHKNVNDNFKSWYIGMSLKGEFDNLMEK